MINKKKLAICHNLTNTTARQRNHFDLDEKIQVDVAGGRRKYLEIISDAFRFFIRRFQSNLIGKLVHRISRVKCRYSQIQNPHSRRCICVLKLVVNKQVANVLSVNQLKKHFSFELYK